LYENPGRKVSLSDDLYMPLIETINVEDKARIGIWKIEESYEELKWQLQWGQRDLEQFKAIKDEQRAIHWLSSRVLLRQMLNTDKFIDLQTDEYGKRFLANFDSQLSISHSGDLVAVILSGNKVGIDLQRIDQKIEPLAQKFISKKEWEEIEKDHLLERIHIYWCGKEALYKLYGKRKLDFRENLYIHPFNWSETGITTGQISKADFKKEFPLYFRKMDNYILAYAVGE
jgi:4'-phosphopantetheinyl transferase